MPRAVNLLPVLLALTGYAFAGLSIWPSLHVALSNASVFVDFITKSNISTVRNTSLSLVNMETNTTIHTRTLPSNQWAGRVELDCSCFLSAGTFRFLLRQTSHTVVSHGNSTDVSSKESTSWWWSSELQVQWPTFHIAVERAGNHSGSFQVGISTNEHFQACSSGLDSALFLEVSYMEYNQIGRNSIDKVRARTRHPIKPLRSQSVELSCAFPFTERDFIQVALRSPHTAQEVKSSGPLYLSRIFSYKLLVENANAYKSGCKGTITVRLISPPCVHISGKVLLYNMMGLGPEEPSSPILAYNWLTQGENETEFNCSVFEPGRNKYCFRFVFNFSHSPSPAQTCLVVHRTAESWGPWQPWSVCSASCGEGVRERVRECLLPSRVGTMQCTGMVKEQSLCSLEDCVALPAPSPSLPTKPVGFATFGGNMVVVAGISLCLAVIITTIVVTVWRKLCHTPQCSSVRSGSMHSPGGRKLSDEASICGHSLQRPSLTEGHGPQGRMGVGAAQKERPFLGSAPLSQTQVIAFSQDPERLSPTGQKVLPPVFGYRLAQQQLKEMKKKGLKEATQLYHVSSSPVHDTLVETSASPTNSPIPTPTELVNSGLPSGLQDNANHHGFSIAASFAEPPPQIPRVTPDRMSPRVDLILGPAGSRSGGSSKWRDRTAHWVEMVERSGFAGHRGGGEDAGMGNFNHKNPNFRRTASFNDPKPQTPSSGQSRHFRERSMTQVGSRTLPEGSCLTKGGWERQPYHSYPIPEHGTPDWTKPGPQRNDQRKPWLETAAPSRNSEFKHTGTNTNSISASEKDSRGGVIGPAERQRSGGPVSGGKEGLSGFGGPAAGPAGSNGVNQLSIERAELNWNRRGPSPIQRNILARKLKEAQSCSGINGRQRSSTFSAPSSEQRIGRCHSLQMSGDYSSSGGSPYRLSEAEQRMLDLDLSSSFVGKEE
ncbi:thrombospondin type-1 domain-containing protein 1 [Paralichthys olivaceus]|uniref:thrombospondin type-1 domain-containing protein 1 n=1 Tax=Paralichthys olivaceus TaxID=8255 RepID=UPI00097D7B82|nr:PREDICTED: thrombospondin type-1 domain-containing protein 1 [Paralichthys olivaceus]XP_019941133.1 PREDICTED: thrombospondin type-1 domain-containing protein 1 [Paralichthys olivaceus]